MDIFEEIGRFWEREGKLADGRPAYVKSFRLAVDADTCIGNLVKNGIGEHVRIEQAVTDIGFTAVRLDGKQFDQAYG
ncbi:MAG: hypothetical protein ABJ370_11400 [Paracoccaceae bacterium]